jgi:hypothetical protein
MLEGVVAMVKVSIVDYEGVKSTEDSAIVVSGDGGFVSASMMRNCNKRIILKSSSN